VWRTLAALLFRPGLLTTEFFAGRRARYLPPVRLYLVVSVLFFAVASASHEPRALVLNLSPARSEFSAKMKPLPEAAASILAPRPGESREQSIARFCGTIHYDGPWAGRLEPAMRASCVRITADNGRTLAEALVHNVPRAMFVFLPLFALAMKLMYWRPRRYYVEHLLLLVHDQAFVFVLLPLYWLAIALLPARLDGLISWAGSLYLYRSFRRVYAQGRILTITKLGMLSVAYFLGAAAALVVTLIYSAVTLG